MTDLHPDQLSALAAAFSLDAALRLLADEVRWEWSERRDESRASAAASCLQAWRPGGGRGGGGYSDPVGRSTDIVLELEPQAGRLARLTDSVTATLLWLAERLRVSLAHVNPLLPLIDAVPALRPSTAVQLMRWLAEADTRVREAVNAPVDERPVPGLACPSCGVRRLVAVPPRHSPIVVCRSGCTCAGESCTCQMPIRSAGAGHIWWAESDLARRAWKALSA